MGLERTTDFNNFPLLVIKHMHFSSIESRQPGAKSSTLWYPVHQFCAKHDDLVTERSIPQPRHDANALFTGIQ